MFGDKEKETPLSHKISFDALLERYEDMAKNGEDYQVSKAKFILDTQAPYPELREGFTDTQVLKDREHEIKIILNDLFSEVLGDNEIKAASLPYNDVVFNATDRFKKILEDAGEGFELKIRNTPEKINYILAGTVILNFYYGYNLDFKRPLFYDIPDANGVMRHYRILYNADFLDLVPTEKAKEITQADVDELLSNFDDLELWKEKIPPNSFISKGFVISSLFDVTAEHSISEIKSSLISMDKRAKGTFVEKLHETFRSLFNLPEMEVGFVAYNAKEEQFEKIPNNIFKSYLLHNNEAEKCNTLLCMPSYSNLLGGHNFYAIPDVDKYCEKMGEKVPYTNLKEQGIKSAILAPIAYNNMILGVLELVSTKPNELNTVNAQKLTDIMPYIVSAILRTKAEEENLIDAIIQHECTSVHPAVYWKFQKEAKRFMKEDYNGNQPSFREIAFKDVYPLYGQIDIKNSSQARNEAIQRDLMIQLTEVNGVLSEAWEQNKLPIFEELMFRVNAHIDDIKEVLNTNSEQAIFNFIQDEINPVFDHLKEKNEALDKRILAYEASIDMGTESYYDHRRNYDESVMLINKKMTSIIDKKQEAAQQMFPHYFERYKTDGVEHNMYIGESIVENDSFDYLYLNNLRLWQLQVMCDMENAHYALKPQLPVPLDVASLILVYNTSLSIRFRMDEKRFDVDGTYNARYEIIKKRIDKSFIKGTKERLTQAGKLCIVYSQKKDELEYLRYIKFLKAKGYFTNNIEIVELEGLQGVSGLKAIRAEILYHKHKEKEDVTYTYEELLDEINLS